MADDNKPSIFARAFQFAKLQFNHPPPPWAAPSMPRPLTLGGTSPVKTAKVRAATSPPAPAKDPVRQKLDQEAQKRRSDLGEEQQKAKEGQRRSFEQEKQDKAAELNAKYAPRLGELQKAMDATTAQMQQRGRVVQIFDRATGRDAELQRAHDEVGKQIADLQAGRLQEEESFNASLVEQIAGIDAYYDGARVTLETQIADAFDRGYFIDAHSTTSDRGETREGERGYDDGGRERE